jgi:UDP-N-acetylmuramoyl-tripeptide--D-alanyl-D-alanine ligase
MRFRLSEIATATDGEVAGDDVEIDGATIDSRDVVVGQLFVPLVAERDGHDFVAVARAGGAPAHLSSIDVEPLPGVWVEDTTKALRDLGRLARSRLAGPVVGVTGSVGKTSAKDLLKSVLSTEFRCAASVRSFNNELGVPLTLLNAPDDTEVAIVELGARGIDHIAMLCEIAEPTIGVVTRIAAVHTSEFGSIDEVAIAKGELVEALTADGLAVLNADDPLVAALASRTDARCLTYGSAAEVRAEDVELGDDLRPHFRLVTPVGAIGVELSVAGLHQVSNALAAAAVAQHLGVSLPQIADGLASAKLSPWRMEVARTKNGAVVINDSYNANPTSMRAAFDALSAIAADRRIAVIGEMAELGATSDDDHRSIGADAIERGFEVISVGTGYGAGIEVADVDAAMAALGPVGEGDAVLVKASRVASLELMAEALLAP